VDLIGLSENKVW